MVHPPTMDGSEDNDGTDQEHVTTDWNLNVAEFKRVSLNPIKYYQFHLF